MPRHEKIAPEQRELSGASAQAPTKEPSADQSNRLADMLDGLDDALIRATILTGVLR